jgi:hypothetical protein
MHRKFVKEKKTCIWGLLFWAFSSVTPFTCACCAPTSMYAYRSTTPISFLIVHTRKIHWIHRTCSKILFPAVSVQHVVSRAPMDLVELPYRFIRFPIQLGSMSAKLASCMVAYTQPQSLRLPGNANHSGQASAGARALRGSAQRGWIMQPQTNNHRTKQRLCWSCIYLCSQRNTRRLHAQDQAQLSLAGRNELGSPRRGTKHALNICRFRFSKNYFDYIFPPYRI